MFIYAFIEGDSPEKSTRAKLLIESSSDIIVSTQIINETCVNLIKKAQFSEQQVQRLIESFYSKYIVAELSKTILLKASALREQYMLSFWDSIIVSSALDTDASILYSEDMQDGFVVEHRLQIINPFQELQQSENRNF